MSTFAFEHYFFLTLFEMTLKTFSTDILHMCFVIEEKLFKEIGCSRVTVLSGILLTCLEVKLVLVDWYEIESLWYYLKFCSALWLASDPPMAGVGTELNLFSRGNKVLLFRIGLGLSVWFLHPTCWQLRGGRVSANPKGSGRLIEFRKQNLFSWWKSKPLVSDRKSQMPGVEKM